LSQVLPLQIDFLVLTRQIEWEWIVISLSHQFWLSQRLVTSR
jgi:hypothetical protein